MRRVLSGRARRLRGVLALAVVACLLLLTPLIYLEPFDPLWVGGVWDDDDSDAVVVLVKSIEIPCALPQPVFLSLEPLSYAVPPASGWRPLIPAVRWPENRAPPDA